MVGGGSFWIFGELIIIHPNVSCACMVYPRLNFCSFEFLIVIHFTHLDDIKWGTSKTISIEDTTCLRSYGTPAYTINFVLSCCKKNKNKHKLQYSILDNNLLSPHHLKETRNLQNSSTFQDFNFRFGRFTRVFDLVGKKLFI